MKERNKMRNILSNKEAIENVRNRVLSLLGRRRGKWSGSMTELLSAITGKKVPQVWPGSASILRRMIDQVVPAIRRQGYTVEFSRTPDHNRKRVVKFSRTQ
jgi:hypothetical protein